MKNRRLGFSYGSSKCNKGFPTGQVLSTAPCGTAGVTFSLCPPMVGGGRESWVPFLRASIPSMRALPALPHHLHGSHSLTLSPCWLESQQRNFMLLHSANCKLKMNLVYYLWWLKMKEVFWAKIWSSRWWSHSICSSEPEARPKGLWHALHLWLSSVCGRHDRSAKSWVMNADPSLERKPKP